MGCEVEYCCCCVDLRVGCLVIGYLALIGNLVSILISILFLAAVIDLLNLDQYALPYGYITATAVIGLSTYIVDLIFNIMLLIGVHKYKRGLLKVVVIFKIICLLVFLALFIADFSVGYIEARSAIRNGIYLVISLYILIVVRSYSLNMVKPRKTTVIFTLPKFDTQY